MNAEILRESIMRETGADPEPVRESLPDEKFRPWLAGVERYDNDRYIYLRVDGRSLRIPKDNRMRVCLLSLKYSHDLGV